jgi:hypothetical protein
LLFVLDRRGRRWTLYSPDPEYTAMFAPTAHELNLEFVVFAEKFPQLEPRLEGRLTADTAGRSAQARTPWSRSRSRSRPSPIVIGSSPR